MNEKELNYTLQEMRLKIKICIPVPKMFDSFHDDQNLHACVCEKLIEMRSMQYL